MCANAAREKTWDKTDADDGVVRRQSDDREGGDKLMMRWRFGEVVEGCTGTWTE